MRFCDAKAKEWGESNGKLYQKLRNLNGSNAYNFTDGDYACLDMNQRWFPARPPTTGGRHGKLTAIIRLYEGNTYEAEGIDEFEPQA